MCPYNKTSECEDSCTKLIQFIFIYNQNSLINLQPDKEEKKNWTESRRGKLVF